MDRIRTDTMRAFLSFEYYISEAEIHPKICMPKTQGLTRGDNSSQTSQPMYTPTNYLVA